MRVLANECCIGVGVESSYWVNTVIVVWRSVAIAAMTMSWANISRLGYESGRNFGRIFGIMFDNCLYFLKFLCLLRRTLGGGRLMCASRLWELRCGGYSVGRCKVYGMVEAVAVSWYIVRN